jgi:hypothetical protein
VTVYVVCAAVGVIGTVVGSVVSGGQTTIQATAVVDVGDRKGDTNRKHKNCGDVCAETSS